MTATPATPHGAYSEVGRLRKVLVHRPALELKRLTPANCRELLFDDVLWVKRAREEHDDHAPPREIETQALRRGFARGEHVQRTRDQEHQCRG